VLAEESNHLFPTVGGRFLAIARAVYDEEIVASAGVRMELEILVQPLQLSLRFGDVSR
jgi:hypothetical protein